MDYFAFNTVVKFDLWHTIPIDTTTLSFHHLHITIHW